VAVPSCAGAYVSGASGSDECPAGSARIETEAACRTAAAAAGKTPHPSYFVQTLSGLPRGCYYVGSTAWFNTHADGAGYSGLQLLCAAATTGAPLHAPMRRRACALRYSRAAGLIIQSGLIIDTHALYTHACIYAHMCTRMVPARRTAARADGGRACTGAAR
jgi:hypothetical protein